MELAPKAPLSAQNNRAFLRRVVRFLVGQAGITQLIDIGSGLPTAGNVSEVAHQINPDVHVVYVDNDPVVYTHSKALLSDPVKADIISADIRDPADILADPTVARLIDFGRPVGLLLLAVLHHVQDDDDPAGSPPGSATRMPPGSYLAISSFRLPGHDLPGLRATTIEGEKLLADGLGSGRWREDQRDPGLVRRLGAPPARPGLPGRVAPRHPRRHRARRELPQLLRRPRPQAPRPDHRHRQEAPPGDQAFSAPSMRCSAPDTYSDSGDSSHSTTLATSAAVP